MSRISTTLVGLFLLAASLATANEAMAPLPAETTRESGDEKTDADRAASSAANKVREGTLLKDSLGGFRSTGDRLTFQSVDQKYKLVVLENLTLERIARVLKESGSTSQWLVSGTVTECQGTNYLLVTRAVLKQRKGSQ